MLGLTLRHGRGHIYRALLEATAFGVRHNLQAIERAGESPGRLLAVGGGTRGGLWAQVVSDVTGRDQDLAALSTGASYGDAHLAAAAAGLAPLDLPWSKVTATVRPNGAVLSLYDRLYEIYSELCAGAKDLAHRPRLELGEKAPPRR
jgi:xylulokinase